MATTISRATWTNDSGTPSVPVGNGTQINNARLQADVYDKIDALLAGALVIGGAIGSEGFGAHNFSAGGAGPNQLTVRNTTAGTSNKGAIATQADGAGVLAIEMFSTTHTASGAISAAGGRLVLSGAGTLGIETVATAGIRFFPAGAHRASIDFTNGFIAENDFGLRIKNTGGTAIDGVIITAANEMRIGSDNGLSMGDTVLKAGGAIRLRTNSVERIVITNGGQAQFSDGSASAPGLSFISDPDTGLYRIGANEIGLSTGATVRTSWNSAGAMNHASAFRTSGVQSITLGAGDTNDLSLNADTVILLVTANASGSEINGVTGGAAGRHLFVFNVSANMLTYRADQIVDSTPANTFRIDESISGTAAGIASGQGKYFIYDATAVAGRGGWRPIMQ